jgi:hypothetical protein
MMIIIIILIIIYVHLYLQRNMCWTPLYTNKLLDYILNLYEKLIYVKLTKIVVIAWSHKTKWPGWLNELGRCRAWVAQ